MASHLQPQRCITLPTVQLVEETIKHTIAELSRAGRLNFASHLPAVYLRRITMYGSPAIAGNESHGIFWKQGVEHRVMKDETEFPEWSSSDWAFVVASINGASNSAVIFRVLGVYGSLARAVADFIERATAARLLHQPRLIAA